MLACHHRDDGSVREKKVQRPLLILAPLFFMINSPMTGVVITQVPVPMTSAVEYFFGILAHKGNFLFARIQHIAS